MRRILTIDGGGIRGVFPAAFLAKVEADLGKPIHHYFDLIVGTSTGGIIAIGLGLGIRAKYILEMYEEHGPTIFGQTRADWLGEVRRYLREIRWRIWGPKYKSRSMRVVLESVLGERRLGDASTRLAIPAWNPETQKVCIFKTAHHDRFGTDHKELAVDVAMSTAAAPSFFEQHSTANDVALVDGSLWANNPIAVGVVEAIGVLGWPADRLKVLSIGCLDEVKRVRSRSGAIRMAKHVAGLFLMAQNEGARGIAEILTGHSRERPTVFRVSQPFPEGEYPLDGVAGIARLKGRAHDAARTHLSELRREFFTNPVEGFIPQHRSI